MSFFGYHRVSSKGQKLDRGLEEITKFCRDRGIKLAAPIFTDKMSGKTFDRPRYTVLKEDVLREGDTLIITEVDRLGRSKRQIVQELNYYRDKGVRVMILELPTTLVEYDAENPLYKLILETIQNMLIELYACLAEGELDKKNKRQIEGIAAMKARGEWDRYGRPNKYNEKVLKDLLHQIEQGNMTSAQAASVMGVSTASFFRYKKTFLEEQKKVS